jgi:hypothetical protein
MIKLTIKNVKNCIPLLYLVISAWQLGQFKLKHPLTFLIILCNVPQNK